MTTLISVSALAQDRGAETDYDPGPPKKSKWPDLFAETPNYLAFGQEVLGGSGDKFRWMMGPMFYRGRLAPGKVRVFVVGQEGAQDENISNRSFTGSTGTNMQNFLNYLGINYSYLFMNTFVYTINGQYTGPDGASPELYWLAQDENSIVTRHRHSLFNYMLEQNRDTLSLVVGVGAAGKDSVATWFTSLGSKCNKNQLSSKGGFCEGRGNLKGVIAVGVLHPGGASKGGSAEAIAADFQNKAEVVADFISQDDNWLPLDKGARRNFGQPFRYRYASIPHRDFPFGTNWRMGAQGTTSNRQGADSIQVFSARGTYNDKSSSYDAPRSMLTSAPQELEKGDVGFEPPKSEDGRRQFDEGPGRFAGALIDLYKTVEGQTNSDATFGPNGSYRGRLDQAKVLVLADQTCHTDLFSARALTGAGGQRIQTLLNAIGAGSEYAIVRTLPVDSLDDASAKVVALATSDRVQDARLKLLNQIMRASDTQVVLAIGPVAEAVVDGLDLGVSVVKLDSPTSKGHEEQWNSQLVKIKKAAGLKGRGSYGGSLTVIPREDLPALTRWWMGTDGDRAAKGYKQVGGKKVYSPHYYRFYAPNWSAKSRNMRLSSEEKESAELYQ